jgi:hypothetical protein
MEKGFDIIREHKSAAGMEHLSQIGFFHLHGAFKYFDLAINTYLDLQPLLKYSKSHHFLSWQRSAGRGVISLLPGVCGLQGTRVLMP